MRNAILIALFAGIAGCAGTTQGEVGVYATTPNLVYLDNGVQVVSDYDYPVFYSDNAYWMYRGGYWYRSPYWDRGWVSTYSYDVPYRIRTIDRPYAYAHYRGTRNYNGNYNRTYYGSRGGVEVRDHRDYRPQPQYRTEVRPQYRTVQPTYRAPAPAQARPQFRTPTHTIVAPTPRTRSDADRRHHDRR